LPLWFGGCNLDQAANGLRVGRASRGHYREVLRCGERLDGLEAIRSLTRDIRDVSMQLNKLIGGIKRPGV
jgi:hypothetical protein